MIVVLKRSVVDIDWSFKNLCGSHSQSEIDMTYARHDLGLSSNHQLHCQGNSDSGIRELFACGIRNSSKFCLCNPEYCALESGIQLKESGIPLTMESRIRVTLKKSGIQYLESGIHGVESRIQDWLWLPYMGWINLVEPLLSGHSHGRYNWCLNSDSLTICFTRTLVTHP